MITRTWTRALLIITLYHVVTGLQDLATLKQKFEYKHSFKGPNLVNNLGEVPFWNYGGSKCISVTVLLLQFCMHHAVVEFVVKYWGQNLTNYANIYKLW